MRILKITIIFITMFIIQSCINPFAPKLVQPLIDETVLTNQRTIEGLFKNFRYSYNFKDTAVYSRLLAEDFVFVYRNYDIGADLSWGKFEDLKTTYGLFQSASNINLIWNDSYLSIGDSSEMNIQRAFSLTIVFSPNDIVQLQGKANFKLTFNRKDSIWQIKYWRDDTYF